MVDKANEWLAELKSVFEDLCNITDEEDKTDCISRFEDAIDQIEEDIKEMTGE